MDSAATTVVAAVTARARRDTLPWTYSEIGATAAYRMPSGYRHIERVSQVGVGRQWFDEVSQRLLAWEMHRRAGLIVDATGPVTLGQTCVLRLPIGPWSIKAPVQVVNVTQEPDRCSFAYGTLPGHPETGEERFTVRLNGDNVWAEIRAFSRPGRWITTLAGPLARYLQAAVTAKYLKALTAPDFVRP